MTNPAHDTVVTVGDRTFNVRREFGLVKALEARFGAVGKLIDQMELQQLTAVEIIDCYGLLLADQRRSPSDEEVAAHILAVGVVAAVKPLHEFCTRIWVGDAAWSVIAAKLSSDGDGGDHSEKTLRPGVDSSSSPTSSDGSQVNSGARPTSNSQLL